MLSNLLNEKFTSCCGWGLIDDAYLGQLTILWKGIVLFLAVLILNIFLIDTQFFPLSIRKEGFFTIKEKPSFLILRGKN